MDENFAPWVAKIRQVDRECDENGIFEGKIRTRRGTRRMTSLLNDGLENCPDKQNAMENLPNANLLADENTTATATG